MGGGWSTSPSVYATATGCKTCAGKISHWKISRDNRTTDWRISGAVRGIILEQMFLQNFWCVGRYFVTTLSYNAYFVNIRFYVVDFTSIKPRADTSYESLFLAKNYLNAPPLQETQIATIEKRRHGEPINVIKVREKGGRWDDDKKGLKKKKYNNKKTTSVP